MRLILIIRTRRILKLEENPSMPKNFTIIEAADFARCSPDTIRRYIRTGELPAALVAGRYLIGEPALIAFTKPTPKATVPANAPNA
jgi:excisionase family DNA binding protein